MLFALLVVAVVVAGALAYLLSKERDAHRDALRREDHLRLRLDEATARLARGELERQELATERDDAIERVNRARRDAAEVAKRLTEEVTAREAVEAERDKLAFELEAVTSPPSPIDPSDAGELWELALEQVRRTWEISVSPSPGSPCPLDDTDNSFRTAVEIEVDAAREDAGASIDLTWMGDEEVGPVLAVHGLAIVRALIGRVAKVADDARLAVDTGGGRLRLHMRAIDEDGIDVSLDDVAPEHRVGPGRYLVNAERDQVTGAPPDTSTSA